jgi:hypothetical protein
MRSWARNGQTWVLFAIWTIQDRIVLDVDEERAVEVKRDMVADQERVIWNPGALAACQGV